MTDAQSPARTHAGGDLLLTGATGFIGMEILARYLERSDRPIDVLIRARDDAEADARLGSTICTLFGDRDAYHGKARAMAGDIEAPELGLDGERLESLAERVTDIVHCAASVSFSLPLEESRQINVGGTRRMLEFAELCQRRGGLRRFSYISTAYVAGTHVGEFTEDQLDVGQDFRNPYERSKFEAEKAVRDHDHRLPIQIFRPSIVVGERASGWTPSFNVLYSPLKAFSRGALPIVPARRSAPVDVVPVDYVADAVFELASEPAVDVERTYHLVTGPRATSVGGLIAMSADRLGRRPPIVLHPLLYRLLLHPLLARFGGGRTRRALERMKVFFPYFAMRVQYDDRRARSRLEPRGIEVSAVDGYYDRLIDYALRARWGKETFDRVEAQRASTPRPTVSEALRSPVRSRQPRRARPAAR